MAVVVNIVPADGNIAPVNEIVFPENTLISHIFFNTYKRSGKYLDKF